ncbi:2-keto-3-deoxy-D-arabino-heptulosonate-7-phosphate synthase I alpha [Burkholderia singularis]|uniref:2-keto-3-deoxy-D-arabino-heptulosonate-7-phosphate synthase I alpha n=1 Tax=Burkholderia singularis TaxID=1503053 RepID=A0A238H6K1_9BURK|nr:2-keto-3-deoxy-D-arabino-heptulosonate-7-phosphate synthase I alpha [Burkholderia singularis]
MVSQAAGGSRGVMAHEAQPKFRKTAGEPGGFFSPRRFPVSDLTH